LAASAFPGSSLSDELDWPTSAIEADILAARQVMESWIEAYQRQDFPSQWRLTHPRIRRWFDRRRWTRGMRAAFNRTGNLIDYNITGQAAVSAAQLPCTELGHCFRPGLAYVFFRLETRYEVAAPPQPEFCVMARADADWRFGGGTLLNRPLGETAVIMTRQDERRYDPSITVQQ